MNDKIMSTVGYMVVGLGVGSAIGVLLAPQSGEKTREYFTETAKEASRYAHKQARDLRGRTEDLIAKGKRVVTQKKEQIAAAVNVGLEVYRQGQLINGDRSRNESESRVGF